MSAATVTPQSRTAMLEVSHIYLEPAVRGYPRGQEILARFPDAELTEVASHWNIPGLHGNSGLVKDWVRIKKAVLVLGVRKGFPVRPNGRSADFIAPGFASGCAMACAYCYVPRRKGFANPISTFVNLEPLLRAVERHAAKQGPKTPAQTDPSSWVYDIGENSDVSVDALVSDNLKDTVAFFRGLPNAKASFATKYVNRELLSYEPEGKTRLRVSLMPQRVAKTVDVRTTRIAERIAAIDDFVEAGYEVHLNFSPVILYEGWQADYAELFTHLDDALASTTKAQLKAEIIFLTHNAQLHEVNLGWHPKAEALLWTPETQEAKTSQMGGENVRYRRGFKGQQVAAFRALLKEKMPYCGVRYAF
jgi:spore photoproduct lyase